MSVPSSGTGKGGKSFQDRELAAKVRTLTLENIYRILNRDDEDELKRAVILKLSTNILPRLNEHSGPEGAPIPLLYALQDNNSNEESSGPQEED